MAAPRCLALAPLFFCRAAAAAGNATAAGAPPEGSDALARLFNTLLGTFGAIFLGLICVRLRMVEPEKGDTKAMGFYTGKIAFPLLIFNTVATANLGDVDFGTVAACNLGKIAVMLLTGLLTFFAYKPGRSAGQQLLTSTVFGFFAVASNDFAVGFPVIEAIYGPSMGVYIAANALVGSFLFVPLTMVLFSLGQTLQKRASLQQGEEPPGVGATIWGILKDLMQNPVITCTVAGLVYKAVLGSTLTETSTGGLQLPRLLHQVIKLFTGPFLMSALFLTGTTLQSVQLAVWPGTLVLMKVLVCAFLSYLFGELLSGGSSDARVKLTNFTFFYGTIPTSSAPLVFASQFDPGATEIISTSILLGLVLAGPIMFLTAMMLSDGSCSITTLSLTQLSTIGASLACGLVFLAMVLLLRQEWGFGCPCKKVLALYGIVALAYEGLAFFFNPDVLGSLCGDFAGHAWTPSSVMLSWLQNTTRLLLLVLQYELVFGPKKSPYAPGMGNVLFAGCILLALLAAFIAGPNTVDQVCHRDLNMGMDFRLISGFVWTCLLLASSLIFSGVGIVKQTWRKQRAEAATPRLPEDDATPRLPEEAAANSSSEDDSEEVPDAPSPKSSPENQQGSGMEAAWVCFLPKDVLRPLSIIFTLTLLTQFVNTSSVFLMLGGGPGGSFLVMLVLESILVHGSLVYLVLALLMSDGFTSHLSEAMPRLCPFLCRKRSRRQRRPESPAHRVTVPDAILGSSGVPSRRQWPTLEQLETEGSSSE